jgi:hypothetical protein
MSLITNLLSKPNDFFISFGDHAFFGKGSYIKNVEIEYTPGFIDVSCLGDTYSERVGGYKQPVEITITAVAPDITLVFGEINKVSLKQVKECSIDELIFAIREKIKRNEI